MKITRQEHGVTLVEMLVVVAILSLVMAGIYGLLNAAYQSYIDSRRRIESQQTARIVMDYLVFRLREIDGGRSIDTPWKCLDCHNAGRATSQLQAAKDNIPCVEDVTVPRKILRYSLALNTLPAINAQYKVPTQAAMTANNISFVADLLPLYGFSESFTERPKKLIARNEAWDWKAIGGDLNGNRKYDNGEFELLEDLNQNSQYDFFGEDWNLKLIKESDKPFYTLVEAMNFTTSASPFSKDARGKLKYNYSIYDDNGYQDAPIATGIVRLNIREVPRYDTLPTKVSTLIPSPNTPQVDRRCQSRSNATGCHGSSASGGAEDVYGDATDMSLVRFNATHPHWNLRGFVIEVTAGAYKAGRTRLTTMQQFVVPRNLEVNK